MGLLSLGDQSLAIVLAWFAGAAVLVWIAGTRMSGYAEGISEKTGIGHATVGMVLLAGITSLPEAAVSVSAAFAGGAPLAVNNLLGSVALQAALLALADALVGREALTSVIVRPAVLLLGVLDILLLALIACGTIVPSGTLLGIGYWSWLVLAAYPAGVALVATYHKQDAWRVVERDQRPNQTSAKSGKEEKWKHVGLPALALRIVIAASVIFGAGFVLSQAGEAISVKTGIGSSFVGVLFLAVATSLPEVSTVFGSARRRNYGMTASNILGTNLFNLMLLVVVDAVLPSQAVLNQVGNFAGFAALLGLIITGIFLGGLIERRDQTIFRMGYDSLAMLVCYAGGMFILYQIRS